MQATARFRAFPIFSFPCIVLRLGFAAISFSFIAPSRFALWSVVSVSGRVLSNFRISGAPFFGGHSLQFYNSSFPSACAGCRARFYLLWAIYSLRRIDHFFIEHNFAFPDGGCGFSEAWFS